MGRPVHRDAASPRRRQTFSARMTVNAQLTYRINSNDFGNFASNSSLNSASM